MFYFFFFFKQKTAYEMRISDWSSDVCSSDLCLDVVFRQRRGLRGHDRILAVAGFVFEQCALEVVHVLTGEHWIGRCDRLGAALAVAGGTGRGLFRGGALRERGTGRREAQQRSAEHTSELQSLMRSSYAVFCLKKKKTYLHN